jgi:integrase
MDSTTQSGPTTASETSGPISVQERLGHSSISITLDLYSHVVAGMREEAAARVGAVVFGG